MEYSSKMIGAIKSNNSYEVIRELDNSGILENLIPEVCNMKEVGQCKYHKVDCFNHTIYALEEFEKLIKENEFPRHLNDSILKYLNTTIENNIKIIDLLKLGIFLHDIGKYKAKTIDQNGRIHFTGHEIFSGEISKKVGKNLNLSLKSIEVLYKYTRYHMYLLTIYKTSNASYESLKEMFDKLQDDVIGIMLLGFADITATKRLLEPKEDEEILKSYVNYILTVYIHRYKPNVSF